MDLNYTLIWEPLITVFYAIFLGGLMGLEREIAAKPAGLRTHMLVAGSAALLIVLGDIMIRHYANLPAFEGSIRADPIRIMEAIITGISFLGAGTIIFKSRDQSIEGLTTAASILFVAAIGITVALQQYLLATILTVVAIVILVVLGYIEKLVKRLHHHIYGDGSKDQTK
jgi:putative Mg2+ transporter-C (MgtC) family protein